MASGCCCDVSNLTSRAGNGLPATTDTALVVRTSSTLTSPPGPHYCSGPVTTQNPWLARTFYSCGTTLVACGPLAPSSTSNVTFWPSLSVLNPSDCIAEKCTKTSAPPSSCARKPKPLASLNHFTVPVAIDLNSIECRPERTGCLKANPVAMPSLLSVY